LTKQTPTYQNCRSN